MNTVDYNAMDEINNPIKAAYYMGLVTEKISRVSQVLVREGVITQEQENLVHDIIVNDLNTCLHQASEYGSEKRIYNQI